MKCPKCGSENVELTSTDKVTIGNRIWTLLTFLGISVWPIIFLGIIGTILGIFIIIVALTFVFDPRKTEETYHCKVCNKVFKKGWSNT